MMGAHLMLYPSSKILVLFPVPLTLVEVPALFFLAMWVSLQVMSSVGVLRTVVGGDVSGGLSLPAQAFAFVIGAVLCRALMRPLTW